MRSAASVTTCLGLALACCLPAISAAQNPHSSIVQDAPPPTPYGFRITRDDEGPWQTAAAGDAQALPVSTVEHRERVLAQEVALGAYGEGLVEPLYQLARAQQSNERHGEALQVLRRALHLNRINEGLYSRSQIPLLDSLIESYLALGDLNAADEMYSRRFRVQQAILPVGDPERAKATADYVEWQRQAYLQGITGVTDEGFMRLLNIYEVYSEQIEALEGRPESAAAYREALHNRLQTEYLISEYNGEKVPAVQLNISGWGGNLDELAHSRSIEAERFRQLRNFNLRNGINTASKIIEFEESAPAPDPVARARAYLAAGDWYQWNGLGARARQHYEEAWRLMAVEGADPVEADALFARPVELPDTRVFRSNGLTALEDTQARAVVSLDVSKDGRAREIEVIEQAPPEDMGARVVLYRMLRQVRFRPIVRDGEAVAVSDVVREYHYQY